MPNVLGCPMNEALFTLWRDLLVSAAAPFFFSQDLDLPNETLILSRKAFSESRFDLSYRDSYTSYAVNREAHKVALLTSASFDTLPIQTQQVLLQEQCRLERGQVYRWMQVAPFLQKCIQQAETRSVTLDGERYFVLDKKIWSLLTPEQQQSWLIDFIAADNAPECLSATHASKISQPVIRRLIGTFASSSGANCFSTTLAAITQDQVTAETIADFWLHQEPFLEGLARRGYTCQANEKVLDADLQDAVLLWQDSNGVAQHACYLIEQGLVINKNSQAWFTPRQLLSLQTLLEYWQEDGLEIVIYRRTN